MRWVIAFTLSLLTSCRCSAPEETDSPPTMDTATATADTAGETACGEPFSDQCIYRESGDCLDPVYFGDGSTPPLDFMVEYLGNIHETDIGYFCVPATARSCPVPGHSVVAMLEFDCWVAYIYDVNLRR